jgi:hypothetical protein
MEISPTERLILVMLSDIYEKLGCEGLRPDFIREAIYSGNLWALDWDYSAILGVEPKDERVVKEVCDILDMWSLIEDAGDERFPGFDSNREGDHASVARMMTDHMDRFTRFKGRVDHGVLGLDGYRRMYRHFTENIELALRESGDYHLTPEQACELIAERVHPGHR